MNVLLLAPDSKIPNLALMKISAYHKSKGDIVGFGVSDPDKIYCSIIFSETRTKRRPALEMWYPNADIVFGGPGYDPKVRLPIEIECMPPDHSLYPDSKYSVGRVTSGCNRNCHFCCVPVMEKDGVRYIQHVKHSFVPGKIMRLLDDNILANDIAFKETANWLVDNKALVEFDALDIRLVTPSNARLLSDLKHHVHLHFAFDFTGYEKAVRTGVDLLTRAGIKKYKIMFYVYCHDEESIPDAIYRWNVLRDLEVEPFLMVNKNNLTPRLRRARRRGDRPAIWRGLSAKEVFA